MKTNYQNHISELLFSSLTGNTSEYSEFFQSFHRYNVGNTVQHCTTCTNSFCALLACGNLCNRYETEKPDARDVQIYDKSCDVIFRMGKKISVAKMCGNSSSILSDALAVAATINYREHEEQTEESGQTCVSVLSFWRSTLNLEHYK